MALFTVGNVPCAGRLTLMPRCSSTSAVIRATARARLISCQVRTGLAMDAGLSNVVTGELEQLLGGNWFQVLLAVLFGFQSSAVQAGLAEPSGGVMFGAGIGPVTGILMRHQLHRLIEAQHSTVEVPGGIVCIGQPMRCLSPAHPCKRVITKVASQLMKTQIALNWIGALIHMSPSNILTLLPSLALAKRVSSRIGKTIDVTPELKARVAANRSRDSRNTMDTKEFEGGTLYATTAGSASNLAELAARFVYGDEIDRWDVDVDEEGDPIELAETRGSTFGRNAKFYFSSSPTIKGASRIDDLFQQSDQRHYYVPCPTCGHMQVLQWERLLYSADFNTVHYQCAGPECDVLIEEHHKGDMLARGEWRAHSMGDGETVGFHLNALYSPLGWVSWSDLAKQYEKAKKAQDRGDLEPMQVFYNTRLAEVWDSAVEQTKAEVLQARALQEDYVLGTLPVGALALTASVDVQANRLELMVMAWGAGMERWVIDHQVIPGDPADERTWAVLDERIKVRYRHPCGVGMGILATGIDSGGHHTHEVYQFTRVRRWRNVFALKGASKPGRPVIAHPSAKAIELNAGTDHVAGAGYLELIVRNELGGKALQLQRYRQAILQTPRPQADEALA